MKIEKQYTLLGYLGNAALVFIPVWLLMTVAQPANAEPAMLLNGTLVLYAIVLAGISLGSYAYATIKLRARTAEIAAFAAEHQLSTAPNNKSLVAFRPFSQLALAELKGARSYRSSNHIYAPDWMYGEVAYDLYRRTKHGEYKSATVYYAAISVQLPRKLPHIFFDSKKSRRRQFRFHFARSQKHSLEGNFDQHFVTYFPEHYTIDSMSFISPDVMQAMIAAEDYDIEIEGDTLSIFGTLGNPKHQIPQMIEKIKAIQKELLDNILTYRDERLPFSEGRKSVAMAGAELKKSKFWTIVSIIVFVLYLVLSMLSE